MHIPNTLKRLYILLAAGAVLLTAVLMTMPLSDSPNELVRAILIGLAEIVMWYAAIRLGSIEAILRAGIAVPPAAGAPSWRKPGATPDEVLAAAVEHGPEVFAGARADQEVYRRAQARIQAECPHIGVAAGGYCDACQLTLPAEPPAAP